MMHVGFLVECTIICAARAARGMDYQKPKYINANRCKLYYIMISTKLSTVLLYSLFGGSSCRCLPPIISKRNL